MPAFRDNTYNDTWHTTTKVCWWWVYTRGKFLHSWPCRGHTFRDM